MLTKLEITGFKTFTDFEIELRPFQVIIGQNGTGKSNLFDALRLLAYLADSDLRSAFQELRGEAGELFTAYPNEQAATKMTLATELFIERHIQDSWGAEATLRFTRLRYELEITRRMDEQGLERLYVTHEQLFPIKRSDDVWFNREVGTTKELKDFWLPRLTGGRSTPFISTDGNRISLHQDGHGGRKDSVATRIERTVLSGVSNTEFPHAFAVREEMRSWKFLQLNPAVLREPSSKLAHPTISADGSNLPTALARMHAEDSFVLNDISRDLANLVPGILKIELEDDEPRNRYIVWAKTQDGRRFSSRVLSDGTLRMLALVALKNDPRHRGVLCFEEPENGVHPYRLKRMVQLLRELTTDFEDLQQNEQQLRQLLVNTHSPIFASQPDILKDSGLLYAYTVTRVHPAPNVPSMRVTRIVPVEPDPAIRMRVSDDPGELSYTIGEVVAFLDQPDLVEAKSILQDSNVR